VDPHFVLRLGHVAVRQHCRETARSGHVVVSKWQNEGLDKIIRHVYDVTVKPE